MEPDEKWRRFKRMAKHLAEQVTVLPDNFVRAGGDVVCTKCGLPYFEHPWLKQYNLILVCSGTLVHL